MKYMETLEFYKSLLQMREWVSKGYRTLKALGLLGPVVQGSSLAPITLVVRLRARDLSSDLDPTCCSFCVTQNRAQNEVVLIS